MVGLPPLGMITLWVAIVRHVWAKGMSSTYEWKVWITGHVVINVCRTYLSFALECENFEQGALELGAKENQSIR